MGDPINSSIKNFCSEIGTEGPVAVEGGKTRWNLNGFPQKDTRFVKAPEGILSAKPDEMIVTALTGTTVAELHKELGRFGQRTCFPERGGTIGGAIPSSRRS